MANITVIPPTREIYSTGQKDDRPCRRVAGYARVSTDNDEQISSFMAQTDYYTKYIASHPDWTLVKVYTDEGISATNTRRRDGFNEMIADALAGNIDLIITKSVSRFARNTVDSLSTIRKLKDHGVEVFFEKEGIWTFDSKGELLITIMSSLAQEESRSISENVTWGQRKRFADGKVCMAFGSFLGYRRGENGEPEIVPEEAETVRLIYRLFMEGKTVHTITKILMAKGIPTPRKKTVWQTSTVESILTNEKYKGDALLQKYFTVDFLQKKVKPNKGELPQYYVENSHPAIIDKNEWEMVQGEIARRKAKGRSHLCVKPFSGKLICGDCGDYYGCKVWHSTDKYRHTVWRCNGKYKGDRKCRTPHLSEDEIKTLFLSALNQLLTESDALLDDCALMYETLADTSVIDAEHDALIDELETLAVRIERLINENASTTMNQDAYKEKYGKLEEQFETAKARLEALDIKKKTRCAEAEEIQNFTKIIRSGQAAGLAYSDNLWIGLIDHVTVYEDERLVFVFKNGKEITEQL